MSTATTASPSDYAQGFGDLKVMLREGFSQQK